MIACVAASAPGKVVLSGEYAVLDGAAAIAMAIDRRASATVSDISDDVNRVCAPGYSDVVGLFRATANGLEWLRGKQEYTLIDAVWRAAEMRPSGSKLIELESGDFVDAVSRQKTGTGSSAATTVALCAALKQRDDIVDMARQAHADLQHGVGSGVDIACSNNGGLIEYHMTGSRTVALRWPDDLVFQVLWTGVAVSTAAKLKSLQGRTSERSRDQLVIAAEEMAGVWREGDAQTIVAHYREYNKTLLAFSVEHDLGIFDAGHAELSQAAANCGLAYKPCGAGGGDIGIVLATDAAELENFVSEQAHSFSPLDCALDHCGVRMEITGANEA